VAILTKIDLIVFRAGRQAPRERLAGREP
jgi:hypothetical protein